MAELLVRAMTALTALTRLLNSRFPESVQACCMSTGAAA